VAWCRGGLLAGRSGGVEEEEEEEAAVLRSGDEVVEPNGRTAMVADSGDAGGTGVNGMESKCFIAISQCLDGRNDWPLPLGLFINKYIISPFRNKCFLNSGKVTNF